jgi:hypothetical protein
MHRRHIAALLVAVTALGFLIWMLTAKPDQVAKSPALESRKPRKTLAVVLPVASGNAADEARRRLQSAPPVELDLKDVPLTVALDELVRHSGIRVVADFSEEQDKLRISLQMNAPPFYVLERIVADYNMELLASSDGWWLRPLDAEQHVCYRIHDQGGESAAPRVARLVESLRKLIASTSEETVFADREGIHIQATKEMQALAAQYLESAFHRPIPAEREDSPSWPK